MKTKVIIVLILMALFLIILIQNTQIVTYRLYFWKISISQIILVPLVMLFGFVVGFIVAKLTGRRGESVTPNDEEKSP
ncbi:MAG: LapA family protein [Candidatus Aminicenantes bacterium]|nr:MAG: LapA family protein [Candidatus Aminicenantes bacterium]